MIAAKVALLVVLSLSVVSGPGLGFLSQTSDAGSPQTEDASIDSKSYEYMLGWNLVRCLTDTNPSRACSVFTGTLEEVTGPSDTGAQEARPHAVYFSRIRITIDDWLLGPRPRTGRSIVLDRVPDTSRRTTGDERRMWKDVRPLQGSKLLIAFYPPKLKDGEFLKVIDQYRLVVGREDLFPTIRDVLASHARYVDNPDTISEAPSQLTTTTDAIFAGYIVRYLMLVAGDHPDVDAVVLSELLGHRNVPAGGWRFVADSLMRAMTNEDHPVNEVTRSKVTESLLASGCSDDKTMARAALRALVMLGDNNLVDIGPLLTASRKEKLASNYRALITTEDSVEKGRAAFEFRLGIRPN